MDLEKLWEMYEDSLRTEKQVSAKKEDGLSLMDKCVQNGVSNGILKCIKALENDDIKVWRKGHTIYCKVNGIDLDTGFGFWVPTEERTPEKPQYALITSDDGLVTTAKWNGDGWHLQGDVLEPIAWMPLPTAYEK